MKYYNDFFVTPIEEQPIHDFCISAIHILPKCSGISPLQRKVLTH